MRIRSWSSLLVSVSAFAFLGTSAQARPHGPRRDAVRLPLPQGPGRLVNHAQGMCLDVAGWGGRGNANVTLGPCTGDPDQVWRFGPRGELINAADGRVLDAAGYDGARGANVDVYANERKRDQRWTLVAAGPHAFQVINQQRGMCLDVNGTAGNAGDNVLLWDCDGGRDQRWTFESVRAQPPRVTGPVTRPPPPMRELPPPAVVPPPPPVRPAAYPMPPERFQALLGAIAHEPFSDGKLRVIDQAASDSLFRIEQVEQVIRKLAFSQDKLRALEVMAPRVVDRQNAFKIYDAFTFSSDKEQAQKILRRNGY